MFWGALGVGGCWGGHKRGFRPTVLSVCPYVRMSVRSGDTSDTESRKIPRTDAQKCADQKLSGERSWGAPWAACGRVKGSGTEALRPAANLRAGH